MSTALTEVSEFLGATDVDPRVTTKVVEFPFVVGPEGAGFVVMKRPVPHVWMRLRKRRPELTGDAWDQALVYTAGQQVYFVDARGTGNFWDCVATTVAGESPGTTPAKWAVVEIPYFLRGYLIEAGYADWLVGDGQDEKGARHESMAMGYLELEADKLQRQGGQVRRLNMGY